MKATCPLKGHTNKQITLLCTNAKCQNNHLLCSKCLTLHKDCLESILDIEGVLKRSFIDNINWIKDSEIKQAIYLVDEYHLTGGKKQLFQIYEDLLDKEFERIIQSFIHKAKETKEKMLKNAKNLYVSTKLDLEGFRTLLEGLYNFDLLAGILEPLQTEPKDFQTVNFELDSFFEAINSRKAEEKGLREMAKTLNLYARHYLEIDRRPFNEFLDKIPFNMLDAYPTNLWTWDPVKKSSSIILAEDNTAVKKKAEPCDRPVAVIGSRELSRGIHEWEISVASGRQDHDWICFGVIETHLVKDIDAFPSTYALRISTVGHFCLMEPVNALQNYDNRTYMCTLDLENGMFTISHFGKVVAKEKTNLKGKTVVPFVNLKYPGNVVKLRVVKSL